MKNMCKTCWLIIAATFLSFYAKADNEIFQDTLVIKLEGQNQIRLYTPSFAFLETYNKADSLLQFFISDVEKANAGKAKQEWPKTMHYMVHETGKRRLKMQDDEFTSNEFNLLAETYRLDEQLPASHYTLYDLKNGVQIVIYLESAEKMSLLNNLNLQALIKQTLAFKDEIKHEFRLDFTSQASTLSKINQRRKRADQIEISPDVNVLLIGNLLTPTIGLEARVLLSNKYGTPTYLIGATFKSYIFNNITSNELKGFNSNLGIDFRFLANLNDEGGKPLWLGLEGGIILPPSNDIDVGLKGTSYRFGISTSIMGNAQISFGSIVNSKEGLLPTIGIRLPF